MFQHVTRLIAATLVMAALSPSSAHSQTFEVPVDADFVEMPVTFTGQFGTVYEARWAVRPVDGQIAVCGVGFVRDARFNGTVRQMLRDAEILLNKQNEQTVHPVSLTYFGRASSAQALNGATANCQNIGVAIPAGLQSIQLDLGDAVFRN